MLPENELLKFKVPEVEEIEVVLVRLEDGTVVARTREELERLGEAAPEVLGEATE